MEIIFNKGPKPVTDEYRAEMSRIIASSRVTSSGYFDKDGVFQLAPWGENTTGHEAEYWCLHLLRYAPSREGIWSWSNGTMTVFEGRDEMGYGKTAEKARERRLYIAGPGSVRRLVSYGRFITYVSESGWLFNSDAAYMERSIKGLKDEELRTILTEAANGRKPPFFDWHTYTLVGPEYVGKRVAVLPFTGHIDGVVIDDKTRELIPSYHADILSENNWKL